LLLLLLRRGRKEQNWNLSKIDLHFEAKTVWSKWRIK
jgi:hypothetical protein